jgi:hypothetical protein
MQHGRAPIDIRAHRWPDEDVGIGGIDSATDRLPRMKIRNRWPLIAVLVAATGFWSAGANAEGLGFHLAMANEPAVAFGVEPASAEAPARLREPPVVVYGHRDAKAATRDALRTDLAAIGMSALPRDEYSLLPGGESPRLKLGESIAPAAADRSRAASLPQYALATPGAVLGSWDTAQASDSAVDAAGHSYVFGLRLAL